MRDVTLPCGATLQVGGTLLRVELVAVSGAAPTQTSSFGALVGQAPAMREALDALARLGRTDLSVLVQGETGTGKELAARGLHDCAPWSQGPFVVLDCASVPPTLAESLLFGHERGAFTGAHEARAGLFEQAHGGTIFLDEVGELPTELQPKLLRVLERREVLRVGGSGRCRCGSAWWRRRGATCG